MNKTMKKILRFREYSEGWNYGRGKTFSDDAIESALAIEILLRRVGILETDAFPGSDGDIMVTGYEGSLYWELTLEWDNTVTFITEKDDRIVGEREGLSLSEAISEILSLENREEITEELWKDDNSFAFSISKDNMTTGRIDLKASFLSQMNKVEYPSSRFSVSETDKLPSVPIFENIMPEQSAPRSYFGSSTPGYSRSGIISGKNPVPQGMNVTEISTGTPEVPHEVSS